MSSHHQLNPDKENRHPNRPQVQEGDIGKFSKQYVLEGERLKVKSVLEWGNKKQREVKKESEPMHEEETFDQQEFVKLEYLEELNVLDQEEKDLLARMRSFKQSQEVEESREVPMKHQRQPLGHLQDQRSVFPVQNGHNYGQNYYQQQNQNQQGLPFSHMSHQASPSFNQNSASPFHTFQSQFQPQPQVSSFNGPQEPQAYNNNSYQNYPEEDHYESNHNYYQ